MKNPARVGNLLILAATLVLCVVLLEISCGYFNERRQPQIAKKECEGSCSWLDPDPVLGGRGKRNVEISITGRMDDRIGYQARYSMGRDGFRVTPTAIKNSDVQHLAFFGCSYTFGEAVNDDETLPYYLARKLPQYHPYNFGVSGYGPQHLLFHLRDRSLIGSIREKKGVAIYTFLDNHVNRAAGTLNVFNIWVRNYPFFEETKAGELIHKGSFSSARPIRRGLYDLMGKSQFFQFLDWPPRFLQPLLNLDYLSFRIVEEASETYRNHFPEGQFLVVIFPGETLYAEKLKAHFEGKDIRILDYSKRFSPQAQGRMVDGDPHPTADVYREVADYLAQDLTQSSTLSGL